MQKSVLRMILCLDSSPKLTKKHEFKLRKTEKFEVKFARTERLKKSAIPVMQKLLNEDARKFKIYRQ